MKHKVIVVIIAISLLNVHFIFSQKREYLREIGVFGTKPGQLNKPLDVGWDKADNLYIVDAGNSRLQIFDKEGQFVSLIEKDRGEEFKSIVSTVVSPGGNVYLLDKDKGGILIFTYRGQLMGKFGKKGSAPGELKNPSSLLIHNDLIYVADSGNSRLQIFTLEGIYVEEIKIPSSRVKNIKDIAVDVSGNIYLLDGGKNSVVKLDKRYNFVLSFGKKGIKNNELFSPQSIAVDKYGYVYVADDSTYKVKKFDREGNFYEAWGTFGRGYAQFQKLIKIRIDSVSNRLFTVDETGNKIQVFRLTEGASVLPQILGKVMVFQKTSSSIDCPGMFISNHQEVICAKDVEINVLDQNKNSQRKIILDKDYRIKKMNISFVEEIFFTSPEGFFKIDQKNRLTKIAPDYLREPTSLYVEENGLIYVFDNFYKKIFVINSEGKLQSTVGDNITLKEVRALHRDEDKNLYVLLREKILKFSPPGNFLLDIRLPNVSFFTFALDRKKNIFLGAADHILIMDSSGNKILKFGKEGKDIHLDFQRIKDIFLRKNNLFVWDEGSKRLKVFKLMYYLLPPSKLSAVGGMKEIKLNWEVTEDAYYYEIYRSENQKGPYYFLSKSYQNFYRDVNLPNHTTYFYKVSAVSEDDSPSDFSLCVSAATLKLIPSSVAEVVAYPRIKEIKINWSAVVEEFIQYYKIHRSENILGRYKEVATTRDVVYIDKELSDEKTYYYKISAVGEDGETMSDKVAWATTLSPLQTLPPLEIIKAEISPIFPANYKQYLNHPPGKITLKNNTDNKFTSIKVSVLVKKYSPVVVDKIISEILPQQVLDVTLPMSFSEEILNVSHTISSVVELKISYYLNEKEKIITQNIPILIYSRNSVIWDEEEKIALFITPEDTLISQFVRGIISQYPDTPSYVNSAIFQSLVIFNALGKYGIRYVEDPNTPYQEVSEDRGKIDTVLFPSELLKGKTGDCDDIVSLLASLLENIGIKTAVIDVPSHIFLMFDTGVSVDDREEIGPADSFIPYQNTWWVPVETTLIGQSFFDAYLVGLSQYKKWKADEKIKIIEVQSAWRKYNPPSLLSPLISLNVPLREEIEKIYSFDLNQIVDLKIEGLISEYKATAENNPQDIFSLLQIGIIYGENRKLHSAEIYFKKVLDISPNDASAWCNLGNIYLLQANYEMARQHYEKAYLIDPQDIRLLVNLSIVHLFLGNREAARNLFNQAISRDKKIPEEYEELNLLLKY